MEKWALLVKQVRWALLVRKEIFRIHWQGR
jgi:hypothetical protein